MTSITYIGMDVHTTNYTLCAYNYGAQHGFAQTQIKPDINALEKYLSKLQEKLGKDEKLVCGYEAGCLGYSLYRQLREREYDCVILAPSTMSASPTDNKKKNDKRDAFKIARCLANGEYSSVYVPSDNDIAIKEYIRMRDDIKHQAKQTKQQIIALCIRYGHIYSKTYWTNAHLAWIDSLTWTNELVKETVDEYLLHLQKLNEKIERFDKRIEELAQTDDYSEKVKCLVCFKGIKTHTALAQIAEIGDFKRFPTADHFAAYLGLVPGQHDSSDSRKRLPITKTGNSHLRRLLTESATAFSRGKAGFKSKDLKKRQEGNSPQVIAYADKANERLRKKYIKICLRSSANVARIAVARELACFIWGMMNGKYD